MTASCVYWSTYAADRAGGKLPVEQWFTDRHILRRTELGDHIWLFASGESLEEESPGRLFLVGDFLVASAADNTGKHPRYHKALFRFVLTATGPIRLLVPPRDAGPLVGAPGPHPPRHIGLSLAYPKKLSPTTGRRMQVLAEAPPPYSPECPKERNSPISIQLENNGPDENQI